MKNRMNKLAGKMNSMMICAHAALTDRRGEGYVDTAVKILMAVVIGALVLAGLYALFGDVVMPTLTERIQEMFDYAGYGDIYGRLEEVLGLSYQGGTRVKFTEDGKTEFRVWGLDVDIENAPLAGGDRAGNRFVANCEIELEVPVSVGGRLLPAMRITVAIWRMVRNGWMRFPRNCLGN